MQKELNSKGYNLIMVQADSWIFDDNSGKEFQGSFKSVIQHAITKGFEMKEVEYAVNQIMDQDHTTAHFGMFKKLMFTTKERRVS
jgi:hypothetical protein